MTIINVESIKMNGIYLGWFEGIGYLYQVGATLFKYDKEGVNKL